MNKLTTTLIATAFAAVLTGAHANTPVAEASQPAAITAPVAKAAESAKPPTPASRPTRPSLLRRLCRLPHRLPQWWPSLHQQCLPPPSKPPCLAGG